MTKEVLFSKQDINGKEIEGATITLTGDNGYLEKWISDGKNKAFSLKKGKYLFKEEIAPEGYLVSTDIAFEIVEKDKKLEIENVEVKSKNRFKNGVFVMVDDYKIQPNKPKIPNVPDVPDVPDVPSVPKVPNGVIENDGKKDSQPKTGEKNSNGYFVIMLAGLSLALILVTRFKKKED